MNRLAILRVAILVGVTGLVYANAVTNGFVWDDEYVLTRNTAVQDLSNWATFFTDASTGSIDEAQKFFRPLRTLTYALMHRVIGLQAWPYHLLCVILHMLNVVLVFNLFRRLSGRSDTATAVAALFAVHPLMTEAVSSITGLTDVMFALFYLLAFSLYLRVPETAHKTSAICGLAACYALSLLSKESALSLPLLLAASDLTRKTGLRKPESRRVCLGCIALLLALSIGFVALRSSLVGDIGQGASYAGVTFLRTMLMQATVVARYLGLILVPVNQSIRHDVPVPESAFDPAVAISVLVILGLLTVMAISIRRRPQLAFGIAWFFITLLPVMNVIPIRGDMMGERFCYLPALGIFFLLASLIPENWTEMRSRRAIFAVFVALCLVLGSATINRNRSWVDNIAIFEDAAQKTPRSNAVRINLIREYSRLGREADAQRHIAAGVENTRYYAQRHIRFGDRAHERGNDEEALVWYEKALPLERALGITREQSHAAYMIERIGGAN
ncbi:MAG: glycosyltransferase family 39 protein [Deltaproteobacteria bacterium]|jgi:hypothetical protein|nr:glycosyltransferase family 39 protein [Deltaproteobacteria bacterium]